VSATGVVDAEIGPIPGLVEASDAPSFAASVAHALETAGTTRAAARAWAESNDWESRWPAWHTALFGTAA
jgi:hypothetical protein